MKFEEVYDYIGHFGIYQFLVYLLCGILAMVHGYQVSAMVFLGYQQDHFCKVDELGNFSHSEQLNMAIPMREDGSYSQCEMYDLPWSEFDPNEYLSWNRTAMTMNAKTVRCHDWIHIQSTFLSTVATQFNLVCGSGWYIHLASTTYIAGMSVSSFISGMLSDRFGRLKTTVLGSFLHPIMAITVAFSPNIQMFCVFRFFTGVFAYTAYLGGYVMIAEMLGKKYRTYVLISYSSFFASGVILYAMEAYFFRNHIHLQMVMAIPVLLTVSYFWLLPESARWLQAKGRTEEAEKILKRMAVINRKKLPEDFYLDFEKPTQKHRNVTDLFRYPIFRKTTLLNFFLWFSNSLIYFGIGLNVGSLVGNVYLNTILTNLADIPANTIASILAERFGRRKVLCAAFLLGGLCNFAVVPLVVTHGLDWLLVTLTIMGRATASATLATTLLITAELYPTEIRHVAIGSCATCSRIAGMAAPYVGAPLAGIWTPLPSLIFGTFGLMSACCVMMLRETLNHPMPDRVEDVLQESHKSKEAKDELI